MEKKIRQNLKKPQGFFGKSPWAFWEKNPPNTNKRVKLSKNQHFSHCFAYLLASKCPPLYPPHSKTTNNITRDINSKKPWLHVAIPCEIWTKLHSLPFTRISPKTTQRKIALVAIHSDKRKNHSAAPRGFWAYPREWQLVQFCASWFLGLSS